MRTSMIRRRWWSTMWSRGNFTRGSTHPRWWLLACLLNKRMMVCICILCRYLHLLLQSLHQIPLSTSLKPAVLLPRLAHQSMFSGQVIVMESVVKLHLSIRHITFLRFCLGWLVACVSGSAATFASFRSFALFLGKLVDLSQVIAQLNNLRST